MKTKILIISLVCLGGYQSYCQTMYAQFSAGYALPSGSQQVASETGYDINGSYFQKTVNGSFGSGINFTGSFGYMFTPGIGLDIGVNYLLGKKYTDSYSYSYTDYLEENTIDANASGISITPSLLINFGGTKFSPYAKLGVAVGSYTIKEVGTYQYGYSGQIDYKEEQERKTTGELSIGIRGGIGLTYTMSGNVALFGECIYTGMSYVKKETEVESYRVDGQDMLGQLSESQKRTIYKEEITNNNENPDEPSVQLQTPNPLSSIGINFGIRISFGGL